MDKKKDKIVLILGNNNLKLEYEDFIKNYKYEIWACNKAYEKYKNLSNLTIIGTVHKNLAKLSRNFKKQHGLKYTTLYTKEIPEFNKDIKLFTYYRGWSSVSELIHEAFVKNYDRIDLLGFDFAEHSVYKTHFAHNENFVKQFEQIIKEYGSAKINFIYPIVDTLKEIIKMGKDISPNPKLNIIDKKKINKSNQNKKLFNENNLDMNYIKAKLYPKLKNKVKNFLIFGNDKNINNIDFIKLQEIIKDKNIITVGVNRIWMKFMPDIFYFMDKPILKELQIANINNREKQSIWITSNRLFLKTNNVSNIERIDNFIKDNNIFLFADPFKYINHVNSVLWIMVYLKEIIFKDSICNFYLFGTSLKWSSDKDHHFWCNEKNIFNIKKEEEYNTTFENAVKGIKTLKKMNYNITSLTPDSSLNDILQYLDVDLIQFITKFEKIGYTCSNLPDYLKNHKLTIEYVHSKLKEKMENKVKNFLIFGNDKNINNIDFQKLKKVIKDKSIITVGINRIWMKFMPDIFYFCDKEILKELQEVNFKNKANSLWLSSDFLFSDSESFSIYEKYKNYIIENDIRFMERPLEFTLRKNSVLWILIYLKEILFKDSICKFYTCGITLKWNSKKHHFWTEDKSISLNISAKQGQINFNSHFDGFQKLKNRKYSITSLTPNSKLNTIFPYLDINVVDFVKNF